MRLLDWVRVIWRDNRDATYFSKRVAIGTLGIPTFISFLERYVPGLQTEIGLSSFLPIPLSVWTILLLILALLFSLESGFRTWSKVADRLATIEDTTPRLRLEFREGDSRFLNCLSDPLNFGIGDLFTGSVRVHNETRNRASVHELNVYIEDIVPIATRERLIRVVHRFVDNSLSTVNAGAPHFIPVLHFPNVPHHDECLLLLRCNLQQPCVGTEFLMKVWATGRDMMDPARIVIRFGIRDNSFFMEERPG